MDKLLRYTPMCERGPLRPLAKLIAALDLAVGWTLVVLLLVMVAVVSAQVVLRYVFNSSLDWADELSRLCFVWSIFIAIPLGLKQGAHIGIELLAARLPKAMRSLLARLVAVAGAALLLLVAWEALRMAYEQWDELMASINASAAWFLLPLGVAGLHGALHLIWQALDGPQDTPPQTLAELD